MASLYNPIVLRNNETTRMGFYEGCFKKLESQTEPVYFFIKIYLVWFSVYEYLGPDRIGPVLCNYVKIYGVGLEHETSKPYCLTTGLDNRL